MGKMTSYRRVRPAVRGYAMSEVAHSQNTLVSDDAKKHIDKLQPQPALDVWMNPVTRPLARRFAKEEFYKIREQIDFEYRLTDHPIGDVSCVRYETASTKKDERLILYIHGGLLTGGTPGSKASLILPAAKMTGAEAFGIDYTLLPEARFPNQLDQIDEVYRAARATMDKEKIVLIADGIGASLALAAMMRWRDEEISLPTGAIFLSGAFDGAGKSDTFRTLDGGDPLIQSNRGKNARKLFGYYAPDKKLTDPLVSPVYGNFKGLPPMLAHVGTRETLLGDTARVLEAARRAGVETNLRLFDGMFHGFHLHWRLPEARAAHEDIADFINQTCADSED